MAIPPGPHPPAPPPPPRRGPRRTGPVGRLLDRVFGKAPRTDDVDAPPPTPPRTPGAEKIGRKREPPTP